MVGSRLIAVIGALVGLFSKTLGSDCVMDGLAD
jgi:hypothetical protein